MQCNNGTNFSITNQIYTTQIKINRLNSDDPTKKKGNGRREDKETKKEKILTCGTLPPAQFEDLH